MIGLTIGSVPGFSAGNGFWPTCHSYRITRSLCVKWSGRRVRQMTASDVALHMAGGEREFARSGPDREAPVGRGDTISPGGLKGFYLLPGPVLDAIDRHRP